MADIGHMNMNNIDKYRECPIIGEVRGLENPANNWTRR